MILFSKMSNERDNRFAICTKIVEEDGVRSVQKSPLYPEGRDHILRAEEDYRLLEQQYSRSKFVPNRVNISDDTAVYEYLNGENLHDRLVLLSDSDEEGFHDLIFKFFHEIDATADGTFRNTEEFTEVFGQTFRENESASSVTNLDILPDNIIVSDGVWNVIDYEWTFRFPIPILFLKWRVLNYWNIRTGDAVTLKQRGFYTEAGISEEDDALFTLMEASFQEYVQGKKIPLRIQYRSITPGADYFNQRTGEIGHENRINAEIYFDTGEGFSQRQRIRTFADADGKVEFHVPLAGLNALRVDPSDHSCVVEIEEITSDQGAVDPASVMTGGYLFDGSKIAFTEEDPNFCIHTAHWGAQASELTIRMTVSEMPGSVTSFLVEQLKKQEALVQAAEQRAAQMEALKEQKTAYYETILNQKQDQLKYIEGLNAIRQYRSYLKLRKHDDPFVVRKQAVQNLAGTEERFAGGIYLRVEEVVSDGDSLHVRGWAFDRDEGQTSFSIRDQEKRKVPFELNRPERPELVEQYLLDRNQNYGFELTIRKADITNDTLLLVAESRRGYAAEAVHVSEQ